VKARNRPKVRTGPYARLSFTQIEVFLKVAETRSFLSAATQLGVTQPSVSQTIATLEEIYPGNLFDRRRGGPVALTPIGEALFPLAKAILHTADQTFLRTAAVSLSQSGRLSIGFHPGIASGPLRQGLKSFGLECPDVELDFVEGMPGDLHAKLCDHKLDLIFVAFMPDLANPAFHQGTIWSERLVAVLPAGHPLADRPSLRWADIARLPIILRTAGGDMSGYRAILSRIGGNTPRCTQYEVSRSMLMQLVLLDYGIAISFASEIVELPGITLVPIIDERATVPVQGIWHADDANPVRHRFVKHVRNAAREYAANE